MGNEDVELVSIVKPEDKQPLIKKYDIPVENLSFEYISECQNAREVEKMILILRSGEEGYFPELTKHAEKRLSELKPNSQLLRVPQPILTTKMLSQDQQKELDNDMSQWMKQMHLREKDLEDGKTLNPNQSPVLPQIRKVVDKSKKSTLKNKEKPERIKSCDYSAWDKYDADTELNKMDLKAEQEQVAMKRMQKKLKGRKLTAEEEINKLTLTGTEINVIAEKEREKGNEAFKAGEYEEALQQYNLSLAIDSTINGYNNRAITYIKLKRFDEAIKDCNRVLSMDYVNVKAKLRRALAFENLGDNDAALEHYSEVLKIEPNNKIAIFGVKRLSDYHDSKKVRIKIEELDENEEVMQKPDQIERKGVQSSKPMIEEINMKSEKKIIEVKRSKNEVKEVKFVEDNKYERRNREVCYCDRAPGSSQYSKPLPHRKGEYCLGTEKNEVKKTQSIFTFSEPCLDYSESSGVIIEEIPSKEISNKFEKNKSTKRQNERQSNISETVEINVNSPYEFLRSWQSLKHNSDLELHAKLLKKLGYENLESIIGSKLDGSMFSTILRCLESYFCTKGNEEFVNGFLKSLSELRRFSIICMFMDPADKKAVKTIIDFLEEQRFEGTLSLRKSYNLLS